MPFPELTPEERLLFNHTKTIPSDSTKSDGQYVGITSVIVTTSMIAGFGMYVDNIVVVFIAFGVLVTLLVIGMRYGAKNDANFRRIARSLLEKLEAGCVTETPKAGSLPSLTECPDCRGPVSKNALTCPHCGCPR